MKTYTHTKIYGIKQSAKGWSEFYKFYFKKENAIKEARSLQNWANEHGYKQNFRVYELPCEDAIIYTVQD